jgi:hypothetical protein
MEIFNGSYLEQGCIGPTLLRLETNAVEIGYFVRFPGELFASYMSFYSNSPSFKFETTFNAKC